MIDLIALQSSLDAWPAESATPSLVEPFPRLASVFQQAATGRCGPGDIAGLLRDVLRYWQEESGREELPAPIRVPRVDPWPSMETWRSFGVTVAPGENQDTLRIRSVDSWQPTWAGTTVSLDAFPASREQRRPRLPVDCDPVWQAATGFDEYLSLEQREAVRGVIASRDDDTVLVLLPTGSGKSLVGLLHPLAHGPSYVSVVVVPTTSLALDQEEQLQERLRRLNAPDADTPFAFHGGLDAATRGEILSRVRTGGQRVAFSSPEALFGALGEALVEAARFGRFGQFVIDEAHIVNTWGSEFRPDFQALAGFRAELLATAARGGHRFRTLLMSATVTQDDVATLHRLFCGPDKRLVACGAVALRPEIGYRAVNCGSWEERIERIKEAIRHLPRPIFLYATRVADVDHLADELRTMGMQRIVVVTGNTSGIDRRVAIRSLRGVGGDPPTADIALGTSAFGLGIDVNDVRCVVHACLPESADRYYQEVGRSGRDGKAALGLMLWVEEDLDIAGRLSAKRLITVDLARDRWSAMLRAGIVEGDVRWVPLEALRIGLLEFSEANEDWNARTLSSMERTGLIRLVGARRDDIRGPLLGLRLIRHDLAGEAPWTEFEEMRRQSYHATSRSLQLVQTVAVNGRVCEALEQLFTVHAPAQVDADLVPHHACGGCMTCGESQVIVTPALPVERIRSASRRTHTLQSLSPDSTDIVALYRPARDWARSYARLIQPAAACGIQNVVCTRHTLSMPEVRRALRQTVTRLALDAPLVTVIAADPADALEFAPDVPALLLISPIDDREDGFEILGRLRSPSIAVLPTTHPSAERSDITLGRMYPGGRTVLDLESDLLACQT
jgi:superfamily II DNA/RNA helicase